MLSALSGGRVEFGLGLIGIGRSWGHRDPVVPDEGTARALLGRAFELGVRFFDTAPSYGLSEERVGRFLASLSAVERGRLTVATKFGEHWDQERAEPLVDHSYDALCRSLDQSIARLGQIELLQLHKSTPAVLASDDLARAWEYAASLGITQHGASASDLASARVALAGGRYGWLQLPFNLGARQFEDTLAECARRGVRVAANRPFGMGKLLYDDPPPGKAEAYEFVLRQGFRGVVLSGTKSVLHLEENCAAFCEAAGRVGLS
jgi:aryl-alcohol dehydrogenase-like predicted oxidoreductase